MTSPLPNNNGTPIGQQDSNTTYGEYNNIAFAIQQALIKMQTATLVRIVACTNQGGLSPVGFVDVIPMVNQINGNGEATPHTTIFNVPYLRIQGGANAIIIDPEPNDIGICVFASRDISKIKSTKQAGNPGSYRQYSFSDGLYIGGVLNGVPVQYIEFNSDPELGGITISSPTNVTINAPVININAQQLYVVADQTYIVANTSTTITTPIFTVNGDTQLNGAISQGTGGSGGTATLIGPVNVTNDVVAGGISLINHAHGDVQSGPDNTGPPLP